MKGQDNVRTIFKFSLWVLGVILKFLGFDNLALIASSILLYLAIHSFSYTIYGPIPKQTMQRLRIVAASICVGALWVVRPAVEIEAGFFHSLRFWDRFQAVSILFVCLSGCVLLLLTWRILFRRWLSVSDRKSLIHFKFEVAIFYTFSIILGLGAGLLVECANLLILSISLSSEVVETGQGGCVLRIARKMNLGKAEIRTAIREAVHSTDHALFFAFFAASSANFAYNSKQYGYIKGPAQLLSVLVASFIGLAALRALWKSWNWRKFLSLSVVPFICLMTAWFIDPSTSPFLFGLALLTHTANDALFSDCFLRPSHISADILSFRLISSVWIMLLIALCILVYIESKLHHSVKTATEYSKYRHLSCSTSSGLLAILTSFIITILILHPRFTAFVTISIPMIIFLSGLFALPISIFFLQYNSLDKSDLEDFPLEDIKEEVPYLLSPLARETFSFKNAAEGLLLGSLIWITSGFIYLTIRGGNWLWSFILLSTYRDFFVVMTSTSVIIGFVATLIALRDVPRRSITKGFKIGILLSVISLSVLCLSFLPKLLHILSIANDSTYVQELIIRLLCVTFPLFILAFCLGGMIAGAARFEKMLEL